LTLTPFWARLNGVKASSSRSKQAFTLFEVILTIGMVTFALSVLVGVQVRLYERLLQDRDMLQKSLLLHQFAAQDTKRVTAKTGWSKKHDQDDQAFRVKTEPHEISSKSALKPFAHSLCLISTTANWQIRPGYKKPLILYTFLAVPEGKKKKK